MTILTCRVARHVPLAVAHALAADALPVLGPAAQLALVPVAAEVVALAELAADQ